MSVEVGTAYVTIIPSAKGFASALQADVGGAAAEGGTKAGKEYGTGLKTSAASAIKGLAVMAVATGAVGFLKDSISGARESAKVAALTESAIRSTGGAAKITATQVADLANSIAAKTGVDDEAIQSGSNLLLTFTNVRNEVGKGNDIFNQATQAAVDMGAVLGGDPSSNAIMLGKALNDPTKGITALTRAGVTFTAEQKDQIKAMQKSGDVVGAQKIIMAELSKEFGGAAEASGTAGDKFGVAFGNLQESIGTALLPVIDSMMEKFTGVANWIMANGTASLTILGVLLSALATHFLVMGAQALIGSGKALLAAGQVVAGWVAAAAATAASVAESIALWVMYSAASVLNGAKSAASWVASNASMVASTVAGWATTIATTVAGWATTVATTVASWAVIAATHVAGWVTSAAAHVAGWAVVVATTVASMAVTVATTVGGWLVMAASSLASAAMVAIAFVIAFWPIALIIVAVVALVVVIVKNWDTIKAATAAVWNWLKTTTAAIWNGITSTISNVVRAIVGVVSGAWNAVTSVTSSAWNGIKGAVSGAIGGLLSIVRNLPGQIMSTLGNLGSLLVSAGGDLISGLISGIRGAGGALMGFIVQFMKDHVPGPILAFFHISSPSKLMADIGKQIPAGLALGIASGASGVDAAVNAMMPSVPTNAQIGVGGTGSGATAAARAAAGSSGPLIAVYPRANQSEDEIATIAASKLMFRLASA